MFRFAELTATMSLIQCDLVTNQPLSPTLITVLCTHCTQRH